MTQIQYEGPEAMLPMLWDEALREAADETRAALGLHHRADVARLALHAIPNLIFEAMTVESADLDVAALLEEETKSRDAMQRVQTVDLLDGYSADEGAYTAYTRISALDIKKATEAARICNVEVSDFAYRATRLFTQMERQQPGYAARVKSNLAEEDMISRKVLGMTDIQPWGEEDPRDYGLPEED